ncbi:MAG TPA: TolC family protein [Bacteroidetes bacterium]|nr:TolC family protein [Bacteroidota bacterium]
MKNTIFVILCLFCLRSGTAQPLASLSLSTAYEKANTNYPLLKNGQLLQEQTDLKLENLDRSRLPNVLWKADASLQSETVQFPGDGQVPIQIDLPLYKLKTYAEAQYLIYDGGLNEAKQDLEKLKSAADQQALQVDMYPLREQVNRYFFGVLLLREQIKLLEVTLNDLATKKETLEAAVRHGAMLESEVDKLTVRQLEIEAEKEQSQSGISALLAMLGKLTATDLPDDVELLLPDLNGFHLNQNLSRPEQTLFQLKKQALLGNENLIEAAQKPKLSAFAQAGLGYPNPLNFFDNSLSPYAMGGLSFSWKLFDWGKDDRDREMLAIQSQIIDNQRETFEFNLNLLEGKYREDLAKLENLIERDQEITALQGKILKQLSSQLEHGVITVNDYLSQVNAELKSRQKLRLHEVQLQQVKVDYLTKRGAL